MADNPQDDANDKGFWDGGAAGHGTNKESSGRPNGYPGTRSNSRIGYRTDIEFPTEIQESRDQQKK